MTGRRARSAGTGSGGEHRPRVRPADLARPIAGLGRARERPERPTRLRVSMRAAACGTSASTRCGSCREPTSALAAPRRVLHRLGVEALARRIVRLFVGPPSEYWPIEPSVRTTRWHGHDERDRVVAERRPDRADRPRPADLGGDPAVRPDLAARDLEGLAPDVLLERAVAAQVEVDPDPPVAVRAGGAIASASRGGRARPGWPGGRSPARWRASNVARRRRPASTQSTRRGRSRPRRAARAASRSWRKRSARPTSTRTAGRSVGGRRAAVEIGERAASMCGGVDRRSCGHLLGLADGPPPRASCAAGRSPGGPGP